MIAMKKHTYTVPATKTIQVRPTIMGNQSPLDMKYNRNNVTEQDAVNAASRGASNWDDE